MDVFSVSLDALLRQDKGGRGFAQAAPVNDVAALSQVLSKAEKILVITGFPVLAKSGAVCCETDGPLGAADMARALNEAGKKVIVATDALCYPQMEAAVKDRAPQSKALLLDEKGTEESIAFCPDTVIAIERPGKAKDGSCHTARDFKLDDWLSCDTDELFKTLKAKGAVTVAIGDGGNELGMGNCFELTTRFVFRGENVAAVQSADITLTAGVSNWWGWGIAAILSRMDEKDYLPTVAQSTETLNAILACGAVDGITKLPEPTVDNIPFDEHMALLEKIRALLK